MLTKSPFILSLVLALAACGSAVEIDSTHPPLPKGCAYLDEATDAGPETDHLVSQCTNAQVGVPHVVQCSDGVVPTAADACIPHPNGAAGLFCCNNEGSSN